MISRHEFPYLQSLIIDDAYAVKNLTVPVFQEGGEFKHLILTGRNGSGKTTVLKGLVEVLRHDSTNGEIARYVVPRLRNAISDGDSAQSIIESWQRAVDKLGTVEALFTNNRNSPYAGFARVYTQIIIAFFEATRKVQVKDVATIAREDELEKQLLQPQPNQSPAEYFKQYLVNKKVFQVFDTMEGNSEGAKQQEQFFAKLEETLAKIFEDPGTKLEFVRESFEFYINLSDGRRFTFNQLSAGFSAFLSILTELLMRTDLLRKQANDYTYDPCGFVLIDEPETHLHLEMQYQILPLLTELFPNLQFIVATHSPAVASSIKNATVFDLSTGQATGDQAAGSSYSELMQTHFGVENEYSNVADAIIKRINELAQLPDKADARRQLQALLVSEGRYMSPALRLEVEAQLIGLEVEE
ncbi:ATP-binding protein [Hymenobacter sp. BT664]|uniref:ATP-binding protein n=1 Tax=Hymenobacter montanus TaxID=2771359 RepID=A0A927BDY9_9BACT|nr:ATP-binding protein [Hymenobacter montanus]MBD2768631.1 ATP-binding protein [Hymenobacter montanus]